MNADNRRRQIVDTAQRLFAQRPYSEVSIADIAEAAGIGRANLHYHFGTKRDLYVEVIRNFARLPALPPRRRHRATFEEEINLVLERWLDSVWEQRGNFMTIYESGPINNDREIEAILDEGREEWAARLVELLDLPGGTTRSARGLIRSYQSMCETAVDEWLRRERLSRSDLMLMLSQTLLAVARAVAPTILPPRYAQGPTTT